MATVVPLALIVQTISRRCRNPSMRLMKMAKLSRYSEDMQVKTTCRHRDPRVSTSPHEECAYKLFVM